MGQTNEFAASSLIVRQAARFLFDDLRLFDQQRIRQKIVSPWKTSLIEHARPPPPKKK